jgi:predicted dehydrogenase
MGISVGLVGLGSFGSAFAELFKAHPAVDRIALCDADPERVKKFAADPFFQDKFNAKDAYLSLDDICRAKLDALVIITQPWLHAPQCIQAMESGKDVYSAVPLVSLPCDEEVLDWCDRIIDVSRRTGKHYMLGETTCFRPQTMFCRRRAAAGEFGDFIYAEGEYCHDVDNASNLRRVQARRTSGKVGEAWPQEEAAYFARGRHWTPMHYPTHSVSGPIFVMKTRAKKVTAFGYRNASDDPFFRHYDFSSEFALYQLANGATLRIVEAREGCGRLSALDNETFRIMGSRGTFSENIWYHNGRTCDRQAIEPEERTTYTDAELFDPLPAEVQNAFKRAMNQSADHPEDIEFVPRGHGGSHPYLVHEFVSAVAEGRQALIDPWEAAHYMAMGVAANRSARRDGEPVEVTDWGFAE